ncbi:MAG: MarR family transcriptional regulator [Candidatus Aenigmarchaeota archaeon]|nr:MarR family transcriptional regulator [Candidatus Aenigmarchaeota archaeon]
MRSYFLLIFLLLPAISGAEEISLYSVKYSVQEDLSVHETIRITYASPFQSGESTYIILGDFSGLEIKADGRQIAYSVKDYGDSKKVEFAVPKGAESLLIGFQTKELVFRNENAYSFQAYFNPPDNVGLLKIEIELPEGYSLYRNFVSPENSSIVSDGKKIKFLWNFSRKTGEIPVSLAFYPSGKIYYPLFYIIILFALIVIFLLIFYFRKRVKEEFLAGFTEEEKKVIEHLKENKTVYQDKISKQFGFTRAKTTRMMKRFEEKGLIEKLPVGRKNKVTWIFGKKREQKAEKKGKNEQEGREKDATGWGNYS